VRSRRSPKLLLADEPTGSLDEATSDEVLKLLLDLLDDSPTTLLMVTHSPRIAARLDRQKWCCTGSSGQRRTRD
jgi:putative ABC transport system ATP-binding protein